MLKRIVLGLTAALPLVIAPGLVMDGASAATPDEHCGLIAGSGKYTCFSSIAKVNQWANPGVGKGPARLAAGSNTRLATFYSREQLEGSSLTIYGTGDCDNNSDWDFQYGDFSSVGWDNDISSFKAYGNCEVRLFENDNANSSTAGRSSMTVALATVLGVMNDEASSARFY